MIIIVFVLGLLALSLLSIAVIEPIFDRHGWPTFIPRYFRYALIFGAVSVTVRWLIGLD
jgi:hypothetical protein